MKRIIMIMSMLIMCTLLASASDYKVKYEKEGNVLFQLKLMEGYPGEKGLALEDPLTREQAMKLISKTMAWEVQMDKKSDFDDISSWAQPYVRVAVNNGVTNGTGQGFAGTSQATLHQLVTWYLRALGYESEAAWDDAESIALELGLINSSQIYTFEEPIRRDDFVGIAYKVLTRYPVHSKQRVIDLLIAKGYVSRDMVLKLGLSEKFAVSEIKPVNLVQTQVTFNEIIDNESAYKTENYSIDGVKIRDISILKDHKSVILTHTNIIYDQNRTVEISNILSYDKSQSTSVSKELTYKDNESPEIVSIEAIGWKTVKVVLSEPIKYVNPSDIYLRNLIKEKKANISRAFEPNSPYNYMGPKHTDTVQQYSNVILLETTSKLSEGVYEIVIGKGMEDFANNYVNDDTYSFEVKKSSVGPNMVNVQKINNNIVHVTFDKYFNMEALEKFKAEIADGKSLSIYHTNPKYTAKKVKFEGKTLIIEFDDDNKLPDEPVYLTIASEHLKDYWGNIMGTIFEIIE